MTGSRGNPRSPRPEELDPALSAVRFDLFNALLDDHERGAVEPLAHYLVRFPDHQELVAREYLRFSDDLTKSEVPPAEESEEPTIGAYRILGELGSGGQGSVQLAEDTRIGRRVALKLLPPEWARTSKTRVERLRREARVLSRLEHPDICAVHEADVDGETPYIAMRLVEGRSLASCLQEAKTETPPVSGLVLPPRRRTELVFLLRVFERIARALHAAHEEGILHRDVKPSNVMITPEGAPVLLDFGLAREIDTAAQDLTLSGEVHGTPEYMSPEQQSGESLDRRSDVYSLGLTLFECLTLQRAFGRVDVGRPPEQRVLPRARSKNPTVPADLDVVLETCLEVDVARRYPSAFELAEELRRVAVYEPVSARPASAGLRVRRWAQRHPALASTTLGLFAVLATGLAGALVLLSSEREALARERDARQRAEGLYWGAVASVLTRDEPALGLAASRRASELAPSYFSRSAILEGLWRSPMRTELVGHEGRVQSCDARGRLVATGGEDGVLRLWDVATGELVRALPTEVAIMRIAFDPKAERVASGHADGSVRLYRTSGELLAAEAVHTGRVLSLTFDARGERLLSGGWDHEARVLDTDLVTQHVLRGHRAPVRVTGDRTGRFAVTIGFGEADLDSTEHSVRLWDVAVGELVAVQEHDAPVTQVDFSPLGDRLASVSLDGTCRVWSVPTLELLRTLDHDGNAVRAVAFTPDGAGVVTGFQPDPHARGPMSAGAALWDVEGGEIVRALRGHEHRPVFLIRFSPDGRRFFTASWDRTIRIWGAESWKEQAVLREPAGLQNLSWGEDSGMVAYTAVSRAFLWRLSRTAGIRALVGHGGSLTWAAFTGDDERVVTTSRDGTARVWDAATGEELGRMDHADEPVTSAVLAEDDSLLFTGTEAGTTRAWSLAGDLLGTWSDHDGEVRRVLVAPDLDVWVSAGADGLAVARAADGRLRFALPHPAPLSVAAVGRGGRLATGSEDRTVCVWDLVSGELSWQWSFPEDPRGRKILDLAFSPDGRALAIAGDDGGWRSFDAATGELLAEGATWTVGDLEFSADGSRLLATRKWGPGVRVFDAASGREQVSYAGHGEKIAVGRFHPREPLVLSGSFDHTARLWRADRTEQFSRLPAHDGPVVVAEFSHDGTRVLTGSTDGTARIAPVDPVPEAGWGVESADVEKAVKAFGLGLGD